MMRSTFFWLLAFGGFAAVSLLCGILVWPQLSAAWPSIEEKIDQFRRQPPLVKLVLLLFVGAFVVYGSTKTNLVDCVSGEAESFPLQMVVARPLTNGLAEVRSCSSGKDSASPLSASPLSVTDADIARGWQLWEVRTNCTITYAMPEGATLASNWWVRGAYEDVKPIDFGSWRFPFGTNEYSSLWAFSWGKVRFALGDAETEIVAVGAPMSAVPYRSRLWSAADTNGSRFVTWENFVLGRAKSGEAESFPLQAGEGASSEAEGIPLLRLVNAQVELRSTGDFIVRSNEVETVYHRIDDFDWDGDGILNWSDWNPYWYDGDFTGQEPWWREYVDEMVGTGLENGYYKLTATFPQAGFRRTVLTVGWEEIVVAEPGEYVFLLEKGVEYSFGTEPYIESAEYSMQDDVSAEAPVFFAGWWGGDAHGEWTVDWGWHWISMPTVWGFGVCLWMPKFHGAPDVSHLGPGAFPMTFEAVLSDFCREDLATYQWTTETEGVHIVSPNDRETVVTVDALPSWDRLTLAVEARISGETLTSELHTSYGTNSTPQVSFDLSIPGVMFVNDDDDDGNGVADSRLVPSDDDDVVKGMLEFHSDAAANATIRIESISGFDAGFVEDVEDFLFWDRGCTQPIREGAELNVPRTRSFSVPLYVNPVSCSTGFEDVEIVASVTLEEGERREARASVTVVSPVVEPICNETKNIVAGGDTNALTYNPCGVGIGERAYFKIRVAPDDFPDSKIVWEAEGGLAFVGGNTGREVCVQGTTAGSAALKIRMREGERDVPTFSVKVAPVQTIGIHAMIVRNEDETPIEYGEIAKMIKTANDIYAQVCMRFYLASIVMTNLPDAFYITRTNTTEAAWSHDRLTAVMSNVDGVECYFVKGIYDERGNVDRLCGLTSESGIVISACAAENTLAHEIGHLCGARDIYIEGPNGVCNISNDKVSMLNMPGDWNGGCVGHGSAGARYYAYGLDMKRVIGRLLMYGESSDDDRRRDLPAGDVLGVWYHFENDVKVYERSDAPIGMVQGAGFAVPRSE